MVRAPTKGTHHPFTTEYRHARSTYAAWGQPPNIRRLFSYPKTNKTNFFKRQEAAESEDFMAFFNSAVGVLQTLVIALGAGLGVWGVINLLEGYGNDNPGANAHVR